METKSTQSPPEPRWAALIAILSSGLVYAALPESLAFGPRWLLIVLVGILELPAMISHQRGYHRVNMVFGFAASIVTTVFVLSSLVFLVINLPNHRESPIQILQSAGILWVSNVLIFSLWYWRLDAGGPHDRERRGGHTDGAFLFPQMTLETTRGKWSPQYIDYLFLSFNTSTALSPTDVPILSRWAKGLVMIQSAISLTVIVLLVGRAVNVLS